MQTLIRVAMAVTALNLAPGVLAQKPLPDAPQISDVWIKATIPGASVSAAYLRIKSAKPIKLVKAETAVAGIAELHSMRMNDGVMEMKAEPAFDVPAGKSIELKPGGMHIMLMQVAKPIIAGDKVALTLTFDIGSGTPLVMKVDAIARAQSAHHGH
jgi:copper(I)-binding protein